MAEQSVLEIILNFRRQGEGVKQASAELREFGSKSKELSGITSILTASKIALAGAIVGVGLAAIRQIPLLVEMGDQYQRSRMALEAYTGSAGAAQLALMAVANASGGPWTSWPPPRTPPGYSRWGLRTQPPRPKS